MTDRTAARLAWSLWVVAIGSLVGAFVFAFLEGFASLEDEAEWVFAVLLPPFILVTATLGALIATRHRRNAIGWIFLATALLWGVSQLAFEAAIWGSRAGGPIPEWVRFADWFASWLFQPGIFLPATFLFLLFPNGRLPSRRWWPVAWAAASGLVGIPLSTALAPGPIEEAMIIRTNPYALGSPALWDVVGTLGWALWPAAIVGSVAGLVVRFRRSSGVQRQQIAWLAFAGVVAVVLFVLSGVIQGIAGDDPRLTTLGNALIFAGILLVPLAAGSAILRHRLYGIDVVINKAVVFGLLAAFFTAVYVAIVVGIGAAVGRRGNVILSVAATAVIAVGFHPLRERARRLANRLVYGKRATPYEVLSEFADRLAEGYSVDDVAPRMARILAEGTGAARSVVWLRVGAELRVAATWPADDAAAPRVVPLEGEDLPPLEEASAAAPVRHRGELLGAVSVSKPRGEALTPTEERLIDDIAAQAGLVLRNVRLVEELRASRQRLVAAQDEERRRLERNIHDGAQQQLVALAVQLNLVETLAAKDPGKAAAMAAEAKRGLQEALDDLRDLARGIYPPLLADKGLAAALESQARKASIPVEVHRDGLRRYRQEAEAAAYFCVLEALQNVAKYAEATRAIVRLHEEGGRLLFSVTDDGAGFDPDTTPRGSGLQNMTDRLEAIGGVLEVRSAPGAGTTISGHLPVGDEPDSGALVQRPAAAQASSSRSGSNSDLGT